MSQYSVGNVALNAPGLPFSPVVYQDPDFVQLLTAFGLAGQAASTLGNQHAQDRHYQDQQNAKVDEIDRAVWSKAAGEDIANFQLGINKGTIKLPPGAEPGDFADQLVKAHLDTMGPVSAAGKEAYMRSAPHVADALARQASIDAAKDKVALADGLSDAAFLNPDSAESGVITLKGVGFTDTEAYAKIFGPAMKAAASTGSGEVFQKLQAQLPDGMFAQDVAEWQRHLEAVNAQDETKVQTAYAAAFQDRIARNDPTGAIRAEINELGDRLKPHTRAMALRDVEIAEKQNDAENKAFIKGVATDAAVSGDLQLADKLIDGGGFDGYTGAQLKHEVRSVIHGQMKAAAKQQAISDTLALTRSGVPLAAAAQDKTVDVNGESVSVTKQDKIEAITEIEMAAVARGRTSEQAVAAQANWLSTNGVESPKWKALVHAGYTSSGSLETADKAPQATVDAMNLYNQVRNTNPGLAQSMFPEDERRYYDTAINWLGDTANNGKPDYLGALRQAHRAVHPSPHEIARVAPTITDSDIITAASEVVSKGNWLLSTPASSVGNHAELEAAIRTDAIRYGVGNDKATAIAMAKKNVLASGAPINGFWTYTAVPGLPEQVRHELPAIGMKVIDDYYKANKPAGVDKNDLGIVFNRATSQWVIQDRMDRQAPGPATQTAFSNSQMIEKYQQMATARFEKAKADTLIRAKEIKANQSDIPMMMPGGG